MVWKFCGKAQFTYRFGRFARNNAETVLFRNISTPGNQVKLRYFSQCIFEISTFQRLTSNQKLTSCLWRAFYLQMGLYLPAFCESDFTTVQLFIILVKTHLTGWKKPRQKYFTKIVFAISNGLIFLRGFAAA